jgi:hypothetical protein
MYRGEHVVGIALGMCARCCLPVKLSSTCDLTPLFSRDQDNDDTALRQGKVRA